MKQSIGTKAQTLHFLYHRLESAKVLPVFSFTVEQYITSSEEVCKALRRDFNAEFVIVRSSSCNEDSLNNSNAGHYESIANVDLHSDKSLHDAIETVIASYGDETDQNEVLVQPMLTDIDIAGVALTCELDTLAPYYIINYESGSSHLVTSGGTGDLSTVVHYKSAPLLPDDPRLEQLIITLKELEHIMQNPFLDVEFAFTNSGECYIFQTRPIATAKKANLSNIPLDPLMKKIYKKIEKLSHPHPNLLGDSTIFGVMPDWNPAEIIGKKPRKLALSLYKELVTDAIWAYQRDSYGYRNVRSHPLLISLLGVPFIDVRVSFNSFIPKSLNEDLAEKLVNFYLNKLENNVHLHDKVEFEILHSCYHLSLKRELEPLLEKDFSRDEVTAIEKSLRELTEEIISPEFGFFRQDMERISTLEKKYDSLLLSELSIVDKIYWLCEDCKRYGTLPFAGIARAGFIAVQFLKSFVSAGILTEQEHNQYLNSLNTVSGQLAADLTEMKCGRLSRNEFRKRYGHLRPGTYDILSERYDANFDEYFPHTEVLSDAQKHSVEPFQFSEVQKMKIASALKKNDMRISVDELMSFIKAAIEGREYSKFVFTTSLSTILELIAELCSRFNVSREEASFLDFKLIQSLYSSLDHRDMRAILIENINTNREYYQYTKAINLPNIIVSPDDIFSFYLEAGEPNFITLKDIKAEVICESDITHKDLNGAIVCIASADPGYDYLFTKGIGGLITQFGGINSHMAIRCAELGLPAVIGAGEKNFTRWSHAKKLQIDGTAKIVRIIS